MLDVLAMLAALVGMGVYYTFWVVMLIGGLLSIVSAVIAFVYKKKKIFWISIGLMLFFFSPYIFIFAFGIVQIR